MCYNIDFRTRVTRAWLGTHLHAVIVLRTTRPMESAPSIVSFWVLRLDSSDSSAFSNNTLPRKRLSWHQHAAAYKNPFLHRRTSNGYAVRTWFRHIGQRIRNFRQTAVTLGNWVIVHQIRPNSKDLSKEGSTRIDGPFMHAKIVLIHFWLWLRTICLV